MDRASGWKRVLGESASECSASTEAERTIQRRKENPQNKTASRSRPTGAHPAVVGESPREGTRVGSVKRGKVEVRARVCAGGGRLRQRKRTKKLRPPTEPKQNRIDARGWPTAAHLAAVADSGGAKDGRAGGLGHPDLVLVHDPVRVEEAGVRVGHLPRRLCE